MSSLRTALLLLATLAGVGCPEAPPTPAAGSVTVFAAASTAPLLEALARRYREERGVELLLSPAASSTLARQIEAGAPAALFLSANERWMDYLEERGLLEPGSRRDLLGNQLVLVAPAGAPAPDLSGFPRLDLPARCPGRLALADPAHVPAGIYAREALERLGWWSALQGRLVPAGDARAVLALVERGECPLGVVYLSDARSSQRVQVLATFPPDSHAPIRYPVALVAGRAGPEARALLEWLGRQDEAFRSFGFEAGAP